MRTNAEKAFRAIGGLGLARCDFFYTDKGEIFLNELNTMPGFHPMVYVSLALGQYGTQLYRFDHQVSRAWKRSLQNTKRICCKKRESGTEIGYSLRIRFRRPPPPHS